MVGGRYQSKQANTMSSIDRTIATDSKRTKWSGIEKKSTGGKREPSKQSKVGVERGGMVMVLGLNSSRPR